MGITGTIREDQYNFMILSRSALLRTRNVSDKNRREIRNTHFMFYNIFFENRAVYEIILKYVVEAVRPQMKTWCMRIACWVPRATNTHSEYVTLIAFPRQ